MVAKQLTEGESFGGVIFDLDNTLYDFVSSYSHALASSLEDQFGSDQLIRDEVVIFLARHFRWSGTVEYWPLHSPRLGEVDWHRLRNLFSEKLSTDLALYPNMLSTLEALKMSGSIITACTNAPIAAAIARLRHLDCIKYFDCVAGWSGGRIHAYAHSLWVQDADESSIRSDWNGIVIKVDGIHKKPSGLMYREVASRWSLPASRFVVIGDSIDRDLAPAYHLGFNPVWAKYGTHIDGQYSAALDKLTPWLGTRQGEMKFPFSFSIAATPFDLVDIYLTGKQKPT